MKGLPVRLRLATWYFTVFAVAQLAFGTAMWMALRHNLYAIVDENLDDRVESVRRFIDSQKPNADFAKMREELTETYDIEPEGQYLQVHTGPGERVYQAKAMAGVAVLPIAEPTEVRSVYRDVTIEKQPFRFATQRVSAHGGTYIIQMGVSVAQTREELTRFLLGLLLIAPLLLLIASLVGYWISRRALSPVDAITLKARAIGEQNLSDRLQKLTTGDELQRLSDTLNAMLERIEAAFRRVTRFTADASHELRTPLSLIRIEAELALRKSRGEAEYREALGNILGQAKNTGALLEDLLALARGDAGRETLRFVGLDLYEVANTVANSWARLASEIGLRFSQSDTSAPIWILGDRGALERLITILLDNAFKYTPRGGSVTIALSSSLHRAHLSVTDTGIGIAPEHQPRIFERFYRVDGARSKETGGSGLGLAIANWIVQQHSGSIHVESTVGVGSSFIAILPLSRPEDGVSAAHLEVDGHGLGERQPCRIVR